MTKSILSCTHLRDEMTTTDIPYTILQNDKILVHEMYDDAHMIYLSRVISRSQIFTHPVIVDKRNFILLDGHHRYFALLKQLGGTHIPAILINYDDNSLISVSSWRSDVQVDRKGVRQAAFTGELLPIKTSKHILSFNPGSVCIPLYELGVRL